MKPMIFASVRELKNDTSQVLKQASDGEPVVVTNHGRPVALLTRFDRDDLEDLVLEKHLGLESAMRAALAESQQGQTLTARDLRLRRAKSNGPARTSKSKGKGRRP